MTQQAYPTFDTSREIHTIIGAAILRGVAREVVFINSAATSGEKVYFKAVTGSRWLVIFHREMITNREAMFYRSYTSFSGGALGDALPTRPLRLDSTISTDLAVNVYDAAPTFDPVSLYIEDPLFGSELTGNRTSGSSSVETDYRVIPPNTEFLIEIENAAAATAYVQVSLKFAEVSGEYLPDLETL